MRFFIAFVFLFPFVLTAQVVVRIVALPAGTQDTVSLYLAGNINDWNPRDPAFRFTRKGDTWQVIVPQQYHDIHYKVTAGSWETCEGTTAGQRIPDRSLHITTDTIVNIRVEGWESHMPQQSTGFPM